MTKFNSDKMFHTRFEFSEDAMVASKSKDPLRICLAQCFLLDLGEIHFHHRIIQVREDPRRSLVQAPA